MLCALLSARSNWAHTPMGDATPVPVTGMILRMETLTIQPRCYWPSRATILPCSHSSLIMVLTHQSTRQAVGTYLMLRPFAARLRRLVALWALIVWARRHGRTELMAAERGKMDTIDTPLGRPISDGQDSLVQMLLSRGVPVDASGSNPDAGALSLPCAKDRLARPISCLRLAQISWGLMFDNGDHHRCQWHKCGWA